MLPVTSYSIADEIILDLGLEPENPQATVSRALINRFNEKVLGADDITAEGAALVGEGGAGAVPVLTVSVANTGTPDGVAHVTVQATNAAGENIAARVVFRAWFSATAYGAPTDLGAVTATTGTILKEDTDDALITVVTDATGEAVLAYDLTSDGTLHAMAEVGGVCATDSEAITGNA